jgi:hypothetical protein
MKTVFRTLLAKSSSKLRSALQPSKYVLIVLFLVFQIHLTYNYPPFDYKLEIHITKLSSKRNVVCEQFK